jgi:hypothetical protein
VGPPPAPVQCFDARIVTVFPCDSWPLSHEWLDFRQRLLAPNHETRSLCRASPFCPFQQPTTPANFGTRVKEGGFPAFLPLARRNILDLSLFNNLPVFDSFSVDSTTNRYSYRRRLAEPSRVLASITSHHNPMCTNVATLFIKNLHQAPLFAIASPG